MDYSKIRSALQELIIRLQDAEEGLKLVAENTKNITLKTWASKFAKERHQMHRDLERHAKSMDGKPDVETSFLGAIHRMFMNFKFNVIDNDIQSAVNEIERGSSMLLNDIQTVLNEVEMPATLVSTLSKQKATIEAELQHVKDISVAYQA